MKLFEVLGSQDHKISEMITQETASTERDYQKSLQAGAKKLSVWEQIGLSVLNRTFALGKPSAILGAPLKYGRQIKRIFRGIPTWERK